MAKILTWRDEWTLRIDTLDTDHRDIVNLLSEIAARFKGKTACPEESQEAVGGQDESDEDLYSALDSFNSLCRRHFEREEEFIRTIDYPGLVDHRREHALLLAELTTLVRELRERGAEHLDEQDLANLKQWVIAHLVGADREFASHYFKICGSELE